MADAGALSATAEDYLEAILSLERDKGVARVRDIARYLSVHKSTVSATLRSLAAKGLANYSPYEMTTLTAEGRRIAEDVTQNHRVIQRFLMDVLLLDERAAAAHACRMEHVMDKDLVRRLVLFAQFVRRSPPRGGDWLRRFAGFLKRTPAAADSAAGEPA